MRRKEWVSVDALKRKIDLALERGLVADWTKLAETLNASPKTIRWWIQGSAGHEPGEMPKDAFDAFTRIFTGALADDSEETVRRLMAGPAIELEDALTSSPVSTDTFSFTRDAITDEGRLVLFVDDAGLVEVGRRSSDNLPAVHLHAPFRIEFKAMRGVRYAIVLQHAGRRWGAVSANPNRTEGVIHVPGIAPDGHPFTMRETEQEGAHAFYCIQSRRPFTAPLVAAFADPVELDRRVLGMVARHYDGLSPGERRCQLLSIQVTPRRRR
jgi:hypothetical protein